MTILNRFRLDERVAIVTGASSGFGAATAKALAEAGADVVLAARRQDRLEEVKREIEARGQRALVCCTDVSDSDASSRLVDATVADFGRLDILVNNAGIGSIVPALKESEREFRSIIDVNLVGGFLMAKAAAAAMAGGGAIVNVASVTAFMSLGLPQAAYSASKAAIVAMTRDLAQQWTGRRRIRVNAVAPGLFETEMTEQYFADRFESAQLPLIPSGRAGRADEVAAAILFLASDAASYITGETLIVDGGRTIF